ncbi:MAG: efflux RND transporter periplasmic adaptor subunit [Pseudooceanicola sp.]
MARKTLSRPVLIFVSLALVGGALAAAFWPRAVMVDMGKVTRGSMTVTINEEGRTRVADAYVVSTPVAGKLLRIDGHPGDPVKAHSTIVARMRAANPVALDARTLEQALAAVEAAQAALKVAEATLAAAKADADLALIDLNRARRLAESGTVSIATLDRAESASRAAEARKRTAAAAIAQRQAELQSAEAQLIGFDETGLIDVMDDQTGDTIAIHSPSDGVILRVMQPDETILPAGAPILEVGDIAEGLEVVVELISSDAVQVSIGDAVIIENWGGSQALAAVVARIEPFGQTKVSALGVEEQRVQVVVRLTSPPDQRAGLGHGYSVEAQIIVWKVDDAVIVPSSALFRDAEDWAVFAVQDGRAVLRKLKVGRDNGLDAEVLDGLDVGVRVVLFPPASMVSGAMVGQREVE